MRKLLIVVLIAPCLALLAVLCLWWWQPGWDEYRLRMQTTPKASASGLQARWFGVSAVLISDGQHSLFIDPFFSRPPGLLNMLSNRQIAPDDDVIRRWLGRAGVQHLDAVLVSHSHFDHAMDAGRVAYLTGARLAGSPSTLNIGRGAGMPEHWLLDASTGESLQLGPFRVRFIRSRHAGATGGHPTGDIVAPLVPPATYLDYKQGGSFSILIEHPLGSVLHHGSAGFVPGALDPVQADVVFLGVAVVDEYAAYIEQVVDSVDATRLVPMHWDDFTRPLHQPLRPMPVVVRLDRLQATMQQRDDLQMLTPRLGQPLLLFPEN